MQIGTRASRSRSSACVVAASLVIHADATPQSAVGRNPAAARRRVLRRGPLPGSARRLPARRRRVRRPTTRGGRAAGVDPVGAARRRVRSRAHRSREARRGVAARRPKRSRSTATRCGRRGSSRKPKRATRRRSTIDAGARARPPRHGARARRAQPARRGDGRGAGGAAPVAARSRDSPHRRRDLRADAQVRGGGRRVQQLRQPAAEQGSAATRPTGRAPRSSSCARSASGCPFEMDPGADDQLYTSTSGW